MAQFENKVGITQIKFTRSTNNFCPLGNDYYTNNFTVRLVPGSIIPDYVEVQQAIGEKINHVPLSLEDAVAVMFDIVDEYNPVMLEVTSFSDDAVHFPVSVTKTKSLEGKE